MAQCEELGVEESILSACLDAGGPEAECAGLAAAYGLAFGDDCAAAIAAAVSDDPNALCNLAGGIAEDTFEDSCDNLAASGCSEACADPFVAVFGLALNDDGNLDVTFDSPNDIYGFQFYVSSVTVTGASGGAAADAGFSTSTGNNTVLGFSFSGTFIPAGSGVLTVLNIEGSGDACLADVVKSGENGTSLTNDGGDCVTIEGCDDVDADGICDDVDDCVGAYDECGVCNGDGIADGDCD